MAGSAREQLFAAELSEGWARGHGWKEVPIGPE